MKFINVLYSLLALIMIVFAVLKIMHVPYASEGLQFVLVATVVFQGWYVHLLKKKIADVEEGTSSN